MQTCPNCGSEARNGAKFCTSCGHRFLENGETDTRVEGASSNDADNTWSTRQFTAEDERPDEGWPAAPAISDIEESGWRESAASEPETEPLHGPMLTNETAGFWPGAAPESWPAPPSQPHSPERGPVLPFEPSLDERAEPENEADEWRDDSRNDILELLDQLRAAIIANPTPGAFDVSGVVSDLEVAVTPPGAVPPDDLAELRDALLAARENPRDVDTIVDLTKRIDGLVALVIAYDRALAAIERSLDAMKRLQHPDSPTIDPPDGLGDSSG